MNNSVEAPLFFVGFLIVGGFFVLNVFTSLIIDNYKRLKNSKLESTGNTISYSQVHTHVNTHVYSLVFVCS